MNSAELWKRWGRAVIWAVTWPGTWSVAIVSLVAAGTVLLLWPAPPAPLALMLGGEQNAGEMQFLMPGSVTAVAPLGSGAALGLTGAPAAFTVTLTFQPPQAKSGELVKVQVSGISQRGVLDIPIYAGGARIETLRVVRSEVTVRGAFRGEMLAQPGERTLLILENRSGQPIADNGLRYRLRFGATDFCGLSPDGGTAAACDEPAKWAPVNINAYGEATIHVVPHDRWFWGWPDFVPGGRRQGTLTLVRVAKSSTETSESQSTVEWNLPVRGQFRPFRSLFWNAGLIFIGAFTSFLLSQSLPNLRKREMLKARIDEVRQKVREISANIDALLYVNLRTEQKRLEEVRTSTMVLLPTYAAVAEVLNQRVAQLERRVELAYRLDRLVHRMRSWLAADPPPTLYSRIDARQAATSEALIKQEPRPNDLAVAEACLAEGETMLAITPEAAEMLKRDLSDRFMKLALAVAQQPASVWQEPYVKGLLDCVGEVVRPLLGAPEDRLPPKDCFDRWMETVDLARADIDLTFAEGLLEYVRLTPNGTPASGRPPESLARLQRQFASRNTRNAIEMQKLIKQIADSVFEQDILNELSHAQFRVMRDPWQIRQFQTVRFWVSLVREEWNASLAKKQIQCEWTLSREGQEVVKARGWEFARYFPDAANYTLSVCFFAASGEAVCAPVTAEHRPDHVTFQPDGRGVARDNSKNWRELFYFISTLLIPVLSVAATSGSETTWWGMLTLGFTADKIKESLSSRSAPVPSTPIS
ncbi:MAG: hypothetical protein NTZ56_08785 [Acidobacteria bacterium]|nr:hypothetical protein [Acidobacteriota bacterium]